MIIFFCMNLNGQELPLHLEELQANCIGPAISGKYLTTSLPLTLATCTLTLFKSQLPEIFDQHDILRNCAAHKRQPLAIA
jgi:hypothetical protein